jgi:hypothetical protein
MTKKPYRSTRRRPKRRCHDCGRPTNDYRCRQCWQALREAGGYMSPASFRGEDGAEVDYYG